MVSFDARRSFEHLDKLSYEIGPRLAGSERSRKTREYMQEEFEKLGLKTRFQNFEFVNKIKRVRGMMLVLIGVFVASLFLNLYLNSLVTLVIVIGGYGAAYLLSRVLPKEKEKNVVGVLEPDGKVEKRVVIGAHYDTANCIKNQKWVLLFRIILAPVLAAFMVLLVFNFLFGEGFWLVGWVIVAGPYLFTCILPFWFYEDLVSPGAEDNASGVAVLLEAAHVSAEAPPENTEIRFVAFGAEEQGLFGSETFSERAAGPDLFLNLDSLGTGDKLSVIQGNGVIKRHQTSSELNKEIKSKVKAVGVWSPFSVHDHIPFLEKGVNATTLSSLETREKNNLDNFLESFFRLFNVRTNRLSQLHTMEDVPEKVKLENIKKSGDLVLDLLEIEEE